MDDIAIRVEGLGKQYRIGKRQDSHRTLRDTIAEAFVAPFRKAGKLLRGEATGAAELNDTVWALKDLSLEIKRGEVAGIIGGNGAGKSTLLKILSRITEPTDGYAEIQGRVGSLLEVGTGFHPELTGRENIYLNGAVLGMKRMEIDRKFDEIVAFSEVERFIDTPVKHYSSGMYLRLAFGVAAHLEPDILLVDEVLAVGDAEFQKKCIGKMQDIAVGGRTVFFVSHNMNAVNQLCGRCIWLDGGRVRADGSPAVVIESYLSSQVKGCSGEMVFPEVVGDGPLRMKFARIVAKESDQSVALVDFQDSFSVEIGYKISTPVRTLSIVSRITDIQGNIICTSWDTDTTDWKGRLREPDEYLSVCTYPGHLLRPGLYFLSIGALNQEHLFAFEENVLSFEVSSMGYALNPTRKGIITPLLDWRVIRDGIQPST